MNKIGILTLHYGFNEGAMLQAFCLTKSLQDSLPCWHTEIIDQRYPDKIKAYGAATDDRTIALSDFCNNQLTLSEQRFINKNHARVYDYINENYKALIVGSDEVWRLQYRRLFGGLLYLNESKFSQPFPNAYWPGEEIKMPKIAYAACIGGTDIKAIPRYYKNEIKRKLASFSLLGVRDEQTLSFLEWVDPMFLQKAELVPDPTFFAEILPLVNKEELKNKLKEYGVDFDRARLAVLFTGKAYANNIINKFRTKGFQIIGMSIANKNVDIDLSKAKLTPFEWAGTFGLVDAVISYRMHGCIFSLLNKTPFIGMDKNQFRGRDSKINSLMKTCGLERFYYNEVYDNRKSLNDACDAVITKDWPSPKVQDAVKNFRERSGRFVVKVKKILEGIR